MSTLEGKYKTRALYNRAVCQVLDNDFKEAQKSINLVLNDSLGMWSKGDDVALSDFARLREILK